MKLPLTISIIFLSVIGNGQSRDTIIRDNIVRPLLVVEPKREPFYEPDTDYVDSITEHRFIKDSIGSTYLIEYRYPMWLERKDTRIGYLDAKDTTALHQHYISVCSIIWYRGNKQRVIAEGIKAIYSPIDCPADNDKLWLKRLYSYLKF